MGGFGAFRSQIEQLARAQHGAVTRDQLIGLGMTVRQVERGIARGELHIIHRGVYLVGPFVGPHAHEMAAVLACGQGAVLSHGSAVCLYTLLPYPARPAPVHVTAPGRHRRGDQGIVIHRTASLRHYEIRERHGIPVTAPIRTLLDFAADCGAAARAPRRRRAQAHAVRSRAQAAQGPAGFRARAAPGQCSGGRVGVDFYWPERRLVVEVDAYSTHSSPWAFERDRRKTAALEDLGLKVRRVTAWRIDHEPSAVVAEIQRLLERTAPKPP